MGWFWSDTTTPSRPVPPTSAAPPAGCPMHKPGASSSPSAFASALDTSSPAPSACPVKHDSSTSTPASSSSSTIFGKLNPLNYMPSSIPQTAHPSQTSPLPTSRSTSSIPRSDAESNWEYPSPQQMYNAMMRKGATQEDTPIDAVESMVAVHNFLNEGAWSEIEGWEARFARGLGFGWRTCRRGEEHFAEEYTKAKREPGWSDLPAPRLNRFMGRPGELTPKARLVQTMGSVIPSMRGEPPFDRHDWFVQRRMADGTSQEVRYVIDYYSGEPEPTGEPVFFLDVRPAIDSPTQAVQRMMRWGGDVWYRASGAAAREAQVAAKQ